jgi:hypothetical protein
MIIKAKIDVTKIDKARLFKGTKGTYLDLSLLENKAGTDQYGNDGFICQDVSKEEREQGIKGPIVGNFKILRPVGGTSLKHTNPNDGIGF